MLPFAFVLIQLRLIFPGVAIEMNTGTYSKHRRRSAQPRSSVIEPDVRIMAERDQEGYSHPFEQKYSIFQLFAFDVIHAGRMPQGH